MIQDKFPNISCCRFVDDYYIYTSNSSQIQEIISFIRLCLAQYELNFNENKIQIHEGPFLYGKPWVEEIKQYIHLPPDVFLTKLIIEYNKNKDIAILKYGLKVIAQYRYTRDDWAAVQSRLINLWVCFPSLADCIITILWENRDLVKPTALKRAVYSVIDECILLNREQELIWAVWFIKVFKISISQTYVIKVLKSSNDLAIIIMLDIIHLTDKQDVSTILQQRQQLNTELENADADEKGKANTLLWTSRWLLAYEATRNKWLDLPNSTFEFAKKNQFFNVLLQNNIKFYDPDFSYGTATKYSRSYEYATRSELYSALKKLKKLLLSRLENPEKENNLPFTDGEEKIYRKFVEALQVDESIY